MSTHTCAAESRATCRNCNGDDCSRNILEDILKENILTSGYFGVVPLVSTKPKGETENKRFQLNSLNQTCSSSVYTEHFHVPSKKNFKKRLKCLTHESSEMMFVLQRTYKKEYIKRTCIIIGGVMKSPPN